MKFYKDKLSKLGSPRQVFEEEEKSVIFDNVIGFIPVTSVGYSHIITNVAYLLAEKGYLTCVLDADPIFPSMYTLFDIEPPNKGESLLYLSKNDRAELKKALLKTKHDNIFLVSASPDDSFNDYLPVTENDLRRMITILKGGFDFILINIPRELPNLYCIQTIANSDIGFFVWNEKIECITNTVKIFNFMASINVGMSNFSVIFSDFKGFDYDDNVVKDLGLKLVAKVPYVRRVYECELDGEIYLQKEAVVDKIYKQEIEKIVKFISK